MEQHDNTAWLAVIAKCLAYLCLDKAQMSDHTMLEKAKFLQGFGLSRPDAADVLGTTSASLSELDRQARKKSGKGSKRGAKK